MADKEWTSIFPATGIDTTTQMPTLIDDQDTALSSQFNTVKNTLINLETLIGSDLLENGSIRQILNYAVNQGDTPPASPSAYDDEFDGAVLDPKWTWVHGGQPSATSGIFSEGWGVSDSRFWMRIIEDTAAYTSLVDAHAIAQNVPVGNWSVWTKMKFLNWGNYNNFGLFVDNGTDNLWVLHRWVYTTSWGLNVTAKNPGVSFDLFARAHFNDEAYLKITWNGTLFTFYAGVDGINWAVMGQITPAAWTPVRFGLYALSYSGSAAERYCSFEFFRVSQP